LAYFSHEVRPRQDRAATSITDLAGILASIVFQSLGAPFWFNTLRQLSNLKPAIAGKVGKTKQEEENEKSSGAN
jgi:hypothetical protein